MTTKTEDDVMMDKLATIASDMAELVGELAEMRPVALLLDNSDLGVCWFCRAFEPQGVEAHKPDCLWRRACEAVGHDG